MNRLAMQVRKVARTILAREQAEGDGARVRRAIGTRDLPNLSPFLMLDHFKVTPPAGFPDHPHRGFQTVTYMLTGSLVHQDFAGNTGHLEPGDLQWMTAGRGVVHAEMPKTACTGMQLWVNLPKKLKMVEPTYEDLKAEHVPIHKVDDAGSVVKVIAGDSFGVKGGVSTRIPIMYLDIQVAKGKSVDIDVKGGWNGFAYVMSGSGTIGGSNVNQYNISVLEDASNDAKVTFKASDDEDLKCIFVAGEPINEPIVQHGPFVMNSRKEIMDTFVDYQSGRNGFENAPGWQSEIGRGVGLA